MSDEFRGRSARHASVASPTQVAVLLLLGCGIALIVWGVQAAYEEAEVSKTSEAFLRAALSGDPETLSAIDPALTGVSDLAAEWTSLELIEISTRSVEIAGDEAVVRVDLSHSSATLKAGLTLQREANDVWRVVSIDTLERSEIWQRATADVEAEQVREVWSDLEAEFGDDPGVLIERHNGQ